MRYWIGGLIVFLCVFGGVMAIRKQAASTQTPVQTAPVTRGNMQVFVSAAGTITPYREVEVKSKANGTILTMHVRDGNWVSRGQLLVSLDKTDEATRVRQAEADVSAAKARITQAQVRLEEARRRQSQTRALLSDGYATKDDWFKVGNELKTAEAELTIAKSSLINTEETYKNAQLRYADTEIRAPISGLVLERFVEEGQLIASGISATTGGTPLLTIGDMSKIVARAEIDEVDIAKLKLLQAATVQVDAYGSRTFVGKLSHIAPLGIDKSNVTVFGVEIEIHDRDKLLKPGMTATAKIMVLDEQDVLMVPAVAVHRESRTSVDRQSREKLRHYVWVAKDKRPVRIGVSDYQHVQILEGVSEGEFVVMPTYTESKRGGENRRGDQTMRAMRSLGGR